MDIQEALKVLSIQGPEAGDVCAELLKLEFLDDRYRAKIKKVMG